MFDFHQDKIRYFNIQKTVTSEDIIPFIEQYTGPFSGKRVLEIGCAEAGVLQAFIDHGNQGVGVELSSSRFESANFYLKDNIAAGNAFIINKNIYDIENPKKEFGNLFDLIILKDVIEHIPNQARFIPKLKEFLNDGGLVFFAYPPWWMPFGGHQQICRSKILRALPWIHLLPEFLYVRILKLFNENPATIQDLMEIKSTGINMEKMNRLVNGSGYEILGDVKWFTNPIYKFKFGFQKRKVYSLMSRIPFISNFYTTAHYILFAKK